jgi:2-oxoisovalerate dehydrogenase E2 component (dihydrolipoyl transacylase)
LAIEEIKMPQLGESVTEGTIEKWLVQPGDKVNKYDSLAEVNTDKVTAEVPSSFTGVIKELIAKEGETLEVGAVVCTIETEGGASSQPASAESTSTDKKLQQKCLLQSRKKLQLRLQLNVKKDRQLVIHRLC